MKNFDPLITPRVGFHEERLKKTTLSITEAKSVRAGGWREFVLRCCKFVASTGHDKTSLSQQSNDRFAATSGHSIIGLAKLARRTKSTHSLKTSDPADTERCSVQRCLVGFL